MTSTAQHLMPVLQALPKEDRAALADVLFASLEEDQAAVDAGWDAELARRKLEILTGSAQGVPSEEVFAQLNAKLP
jgi:putative addiction module component (TIGR02574 family)